MIDFDDAPEVGAGQLQKNLASPFDDQTPLEKLPGFLARLNPRQREAALHLEGPQVVLAGAGSGKTSMITARIAYLIGYCGVPASQVLAVTFTNKAAGEMRLRVERALDEAAASGNGAFLGSAEIGTFHAVCTRILRKERDHLPFSKPFVIFDDSDQLSLVKRVMKKLDIDVKATSPKAIQSAINLAKCDALEPHELSPARFSRFEQVLKEVYEEYQRELVTCNALDFGEIICTTYRLLRDQESVRQHYQRRFRFIHVDEYQDTNRAQYLLLSTLAGSNHGGHSNICVVGDEDQSIYKWRGADIRNILDFETEYPKAKLVKLEQNYRSTKSIIEASSHLISHNKERKKKELWTENVQGLPLERYQYPDERAEAHGVMGQIKGLVDGGDINYDECAIFYRTHAQSRQFEDVFRREKIAYQIVGGLRFYDRKEIKDILAYLRVIMNPSDTVSLLRIINVPARGIGKTTIDRLEKMLQEEEEFSDLWRLLVKVTSKHWVFSGRTLSKLKAFVDMIERLMSFQQKMSVAELYHVILDETGYVRNLRQEGTVEAAARVENLEELDSVLQEFGEDYSKRLPADLGSEQRELAVRQMLPRFLEQITLSSTIDQEFDPAAVKLMTFHAAKGLEFPIVFMVGMEEGLFPSTRPWEAGTDEDMEEERRLCYVGMTRAKKHLYLTNALVRRVRGEICYQEPARFFSEIPAELVQMKDFSGRVGLVTSASAVREDIVVEDEPEWIGYQVNHPRYGPGTIVSSEGSGDAQKVIVDFGGRSKRKFLLKYLLQG